MELHAIPEVYIYIFIYIVCVDGLYIVCIHIASYSMMIQ
jgi:hypothetical protein